MIFYILAALALLLAIVWFVKSQNSGEDSVSETEPKLSPIELTQQALLDVNLALRKTEIPAELLAVCEDLVDRLVETIPVVLAGAPDSELAWTLQRIATEYLPQKTIYPYLALDKQQRFSKEKSTQVFNAVSGMRDELVEVEELLKSKAEQDFSAKAAFIKAKFNL